MGIFEKVLERRDIAWDEPKAWDKSLWNLYGNQSAAGVTVNEYTALNLDAVYNAITVLSRSIAALPMHLYRKKGNGAEIMKIHPLDRIVHSEANIYMTAMTCREVAIAHGVSW